jgi:hypothetical protein
MPRVVTLPHEGTLIASTDLHGNLDDYHAVVGRFRALTGRPGPPPHLLFCGDVVHGPAFTRADWPEHLGTYYADQTPELLAALRDLRTEFPGRIHLLLGNHEYAHLGGTGVAKFHADEAAYLESLYDDFGDVRDWLATWALVAVAPRARVAFTHAAPHVRISGVDELETLPLRDLKGLLWARTTDPGRAYGFLRALGSDCRVAVFGHDVIQEGHVVEHEPLLCFSTSFGCHDGDKVYLEWDLSRAARDATGVAADGLRPLYPHATPVYRNA